MRNAIMCAAIGLAIFGLFVFAHPAAQAAIDEEEQALPVPNTGFVPSQIGSSTGGFTQEVPIELPAYRGLQPALALTYSSAGSTGEVGVGWQLSGVSEIERTSLPGYGAPRFDTTDGFLLDGQELIACPSGSTSPSCTTSAAGTKYNTKIETYLRIRRNTSPNNWEVWAPDGTKRTYVTVGSLAGGNTTDIGAQYRWVLRTVVDTHGNSVQYNYTCPTLPDCYVDTIDYNGNSVKFYWETRPDTITYATGVGLSSITKRLKTIDVVAGGQRVRAYTLTYSSATTTPRSRLASVQQFGRDSTVSTGGVVSGGAPLPPITLTYSAATNAFTNPEWSAGSSQLDDRHFWRTGDFNGDGRTDFAKQLSGATNCSFEVQLSTGSDIAPSTWQATPCTVLFTTDWTTGDFNGDG
jgi:hypothetical protein